LGQTLEIQSLQVVITLIGYDADASSATATNEITLGNSSVASLRIPGLQSGASDGDVLTFSSGTGSITLQAAGGGGASDLNGLSDCLVTAQASQFIGNVPANVTSGAYNNTSLGHNALELITGGDNNIGIGWNAGSAITDGAGNVIVGRSALSGGNLSETVAIGHLAALNATGSNSTHVGSDAGRANSSAGHISVKHKYRLLCWLFKYNRN